MQARGRTAVTNKRVVAAEVVVAAVVRSAGTAVVDDSRTAVGKP